MAGLHRKTQVTRQVELEAEEKKLANERLVVTGRRATPETWVLCLQVAGRRVKCRCLTLSLHLLPSCFFFFFFKCKGGRCAMKTTAGGSSL